MSNERIFQCENLPELAASTKNWLVESGFNCQQLEIDDKKILLQVEKNGKWRLAVGMSTALNIIFHPMEDSVRVEMSPGRWLDKAGVAAVGLIGAAAVSTLVLWPLAVTAGLGA